MDWNLSTAARTLKQEADSEPLAGQQAVAHTFINRRNSGRWGNTFGSVCLARSQYSAWGPVIPSNPNMLANFRASCAISDDDPDLIRLANIITAAETAPDPTGGATHYYNPDDVPEPAWVKGDPSYGIHPATPCGKFGNQLFYKDVR